MSSPVEVTRLVHPGHMKRTILDLEEVRTSLVNAHWVWQRLEALGRGRVGHRRGGHT